MSDASHTSHPATSITEYTPPPVGQIIKRRLLTMLKFAGLFAAIFAITMLGVKNSAMRNLGDFSRQTLTMRAFQMQARLDGMHAPEGPTVMRLNGQEMIVTFSNHGEEEIDAVLSAQEAQCESSDGWFERDDTAPGEGYLACAEGGQSAPLSDRLQAFMDSNELTDLGPLSFTFAMKSEEGTRSVELKPGEHFNLQALFNPDGDVPGDDPIDLPRPQGTRRVLDARVQGEPYALITFAGSERAPAEAMVEYLTQVDRAIWYVTRFEENDTFVALTRRDDPSRFTYVLFHPAEHTESFKTMVLFAEAQ